jgi:ribosome recycling factor
MDKNAFLKDMKVRMDNTINNLDNDLKGLRTGRATANLLDPVHVESYGSRVPLSQVATVSVADARTISVQVWDKGMLKTVEKAIVEASLGVTPIADGNSIRIPIPPLTEERRKELVKIGGKYGENAKISIRNIRRDAMDDLKKLEKDSKISKDEHHSCSDDVQKVTDDYSGKIDSKVKQKEQEIMTL